jgi:hypothetical protein
MLASITPLGERGRRSTWGFTVSAFLLGATVAGAAAGALGGALGLLVIPAGIDARARLALLAAAALVAVLLDVIPRAVPGPRRQVNERWLDQYRGWVYGVGYGAQLGLGVTTMVSSAATYVALLAAVETSSIGAGALIMGLHGAVRGLTPLATVHVRSPAELVSVHARLTRWQAPVARAVPLLLAGVLVFAAASGLT